MSKIHKIYVLYTGVFCKIGVTSRSVEDRLKEIQVSCPLPIYSYDVISPLSKGMAYHIENLLKTELSTHLTQGEWYKQFPNVLHSISYLIKTNCLETYTLERKNTKLKRFEDISIKVLNEIKSLRAKQDINKLSKLYNNFISNSEQYNETRFLMYSRDDVIKQLEIAIKNCIGYFKNNQLKIEPAVEKSLIRNKKKYEEFYNKEYIPHVNVNKNKKIKDDESLKDFYKKHGL